MGLLEPITHKEEIENLLNEAQTIYDTALNNSNFPLGPTLEKR